MWAVLFALAIVPRAFLKVPGMLRLLNVPMCPFRWLEEIS